MKTFMRIPIGAAVAGLYYLVGGLSAVNGGSTAMAQAEGIMVVGLLLGWCAIQ